MIRLKNGCTCSVPAITPACWKDDPKSITRNWTMQYRFYDPLQTDRYPKGKQINVAAGLNRIKSYSERKIAAKELLATELHNLKELDYNPITRMYSEAATNDAIEYVISPDMPLCEAWQAAYERMDHVEGTLKDLRSVMKYCKMAAQRLRMDQKPIKDIARRHVILMLDQCREIKATWTAKTYNWYRANLYMLFKELEKVEAITHNPVEKIEIKDHKVTKRVTLTPDQRVAVDQHLRTVNYRFWLFVQIFFHSGGRETEILKVKGKDVDLIKQQATYTVKKGSSEREVARPIKDIVLNLWEQALIGCGPEQYIFSKDLKPGERSIRAEQLTRRWRRYVKKPLGITADLYSLKHLNTTEMSARVGTAVTALLNRHGEDVLKKHYDVGGEQREMDIIKSVGNSFAGD